MSMSDFADGSTGWTLCTRRFRSYRAALRFANKLPGDWDIERIGEGAYDVLWGETHDGKAVVSGSTVTFAGY